MNPRNITKMIKHKFDYYSFKIFSRFWLVKTTRIIHHNQLLSTKFGKNLRHIESMTSKVQPAENYWTDDVKMTSKVQPATDCWTIDWENLGTRLCYIWWAENKERNGKTSLRKRKYFEWIIKQLLNSAFKGYEEFCRSRRVLATLGSITSRCSGKEPAFFSGRVDQTRESGGNRAYIHLGLRPLWVTLSLICRILHILLGLHARRDYIYLCHSRTFYQCFTKFWWLSSKYCSEVRWYKGTFQWRQNHQTYFTTFKTLPRHVLASVWPDKNSKRQEYQVLSLQQVFCLVRLFSEKRLRDASK